jgi:TonB family protein
MARSWWQRLLILVLCTSSLCFAEIKLSDAEARKAATTKPAPVLNPMARQLKLSGRVELTVSIDEEGAVSDVHVDTGNPVLAACSVEAVKKWKFTPFLQDGKPVKATAALVFDYKL